MNEKTSKETTFKVTQPAIKDVKVVGTIDLDAINQRTRPPKKSKQEKERDRREQRKANKANQQKAQNTPDNNAIDASLINDEDTDTRKKRKRIHRQDEKVQVESIANSPGGKPSKIEDSKRKLKKQIGRAHV